MAARKAGPNLPDEGEFRDATEEELHDFAVEKGNSEKAAAYFAETNVERGGYLVDANGKVQFSVERYKQGVGA